jgi:hypothetical protein
MTDIAAARTNQRALSLILKSPPGTIAECRRLNCG